MGTKYRPSIKDQKATQRFHSNARRAAANGPVKKSLFLTGAPPKPAPRAADTPPLTDQAPATPPPPPRRSQSRG